MSAPIVADNPKRPNAVQRFYRPKVDPDSLPPDYFGLLSLLFGISAVMLKIKIFSWLALVAGMGSIANAKTSDADYKQIVTSMMLSVMSLFLNYFGPVPPQQAPRE